MGKEVEELTIRDLLSSYYYKYELERLCKKNKLYQKGPKSELIDRLLDETDYTIIDYVNFLDKDSLKTICNDFGEFISGRKEDLIKRIIPHLSGNFNKKDLEEEDEERKIIEKKEVSSKSILDMDEIVGLIEKWTPDRRYKNESGYQGELYSFLKHKYQLKVRQEAGKSNADILVDDRIAIEIKKNPSSGEYDRLYGQLVRQKKEFGNVIALIIDVRNKDLFDEFKENIGGSDDIIVIRK